MKWYEIAWIVVACILVLIMIQDLIRRLRFNRIEKKLKTLIHKVYGDQPVTTHKADHIYQLAFNAERPWLVKWIDMNPRNEVIITNADKVVINDDIKNWKRSSKPHFVAGIKELMAYRKDDPDVIKVVLIYPGCHNITKYVNETDCYLVKRFESVDGLTFVKYEDFEEFLKNQ